ATRHTRLVLESEQCGQLALTNPPRHPIFSSRVDHDLSPLIVARANRPPTQSLSTASHECSASLLWALPAPTTFSTAAAAPTILQHSSWRTLPSCPPAKAAFTRCCPTSVLTAARYVHPPRPLAMFSPRLIEHAASGLPPSHLDGSGADSPSQLLMRPLPVPIVLWIRRGCRAPGSRHRRQPMWCVALLRRRPCTGSLHVCSRRANRSSARSRYTRWSATPVSTLPYTPRPAGFKAGTARLVPRATDRASCSQCICSRQTLEHALHTV
ncbi:hypothetical protein FRC08_014027, partial [Ceratobasidium sp. 394]